MPTFGDGDSMSRPMWSGDFFTCPQGSTGINESWYLHKNAEANTAPIWTLWDPAIGDQMDSAFENEAGWQKALGVPLGHAYLNDRGGELKPFTRWFKASIFDHRTWLSNSQPSGYLADASYTLASGTPRYAWQRFGTGLGDCNAIAAGNAMNKMIQNTKLRVQFNPVWGNAIGDITYLPTNKSIVSHSIGDMLQSVVWYGGAGGYPVNPTQSGSVNAANYGDTRFWSGSPLVNAGTIQGTGANPKYLTTVVRPLNFQNNRYVGTDAWTPMAWRGLFQVTTTVGCKLSGTTYDDVVKVQLKVQKDSPTAITETNLNHNNVGWFMYSEFVDCTPSGRAIADLVNLTTGAVVESVPLACVDSPGGGTNDQSFTKNWDNKTNFGVRIRRQDNSLAIGNVRLGTNYRYSVNVFCGWDCGAPESPKLVISDFNFRTVTSSTTFQNHPGEDAYWIVGTPSEVLSRMTAIKADAGGGSSSDCIN